MALRQGLPPAFQDLRTIQTLIFDFAWGLKPSRNSEEIAEILQYEPSDAIIISGFRGIAKTAAGVSWVLHGGILDPDDKSLFLSADGDFADRLATWCYNLVHYMPVFEFLRPTLGQKDSATAFDFAGCRFDKDPSVSSRGLSSGLAGLRPRKLIFDDCENKRTSRSATERANLRMFLSEPENLLQTYRRDDPTFKTRRVMFQTPHNADTIIRDFEEIYGYKPFYWPIVYPKPGSRVAKRLSPRLARELAENPALASGGGLDLRRGQPTDVERYPEEEITKKAAKLTRPEFRFQYELDIETDAATRFPGRCEDFSVLDLNGCVDLAPERILWGKEPHLKIADLECFGFDGDGWYRPAAILGSYIPWKVKGMVVDPAGRGGDELAYLVFGVSNSTIYFLALGGLLGGSSIENLERLSHIAIRWKVDKARTEDDNMREELFARTWQPILSRVAGSVGQTIGIESEPAVGSKGIRIRADLGLAAEQHRIVFNRQICEDEAKIREGLSEEDERGYRFGYQWTHLAIDDPRCEELPHDDRIDVGAKAVKMARELMGEDLDEAIERRRKRTRDELHELWCQKMREQDGEVAKSALGSFGTFQ